MPLGTTPSSWSGACSFGEHRFCPVCGVLPALVTALDALDAESLRLQVLADVPEPARSSLRESGVLHRTWVDTIENVVGIVEVLAERMFRAVVSDADAQLKGKGKVFQRLDDFADDEHERVHTAITASDGRRQVVSRWWDLRSDGRDVVMFAATNESATELNRAAQKLRLSECEVIQPVRRIALADGTPALIGDEVQTRQNDRSLVTDAGVTVKNRQRWTIDQVDPDGSITVVDDGRCRVTLPREYVADSLSLAYASTAMAGQGRTVDHSLVLVDGAIDAAGLYVPMTRGRESNDVWVVTDATSPSDAVDVLAEVMQRCWIDEPAIERLPAAEIGLD